MEIVAAITVCLDFALDLMNFRNDRFLVLCTLGKVIVLLM